MVRGKLGATLVFGVVLLLAALASTLGSQGLSQVQAANGDNLRTITADASGTECAAGNPNFDVGVGLAFNGANLLISCYNDSKITVVNPADGSQVAVRTITGASSLGALAWDNGRGLLWACNNFIDVGTIDATNAFTFKFTSPGCFDGLAYDGADDTLWTSPDATNVVTHSTITGTVLGTFFPAMPCGNSGIAVGGALLYLANNGCSQIYTSPKNFSTPAALFAAFPARLEDLECDNVTFAGAGKGAMWSKDAYDNILNAWEIPIGSCTFGGGVQKDTTAPSCVLTAVIAGPPKQLQITAQDAGSGISTITVLTATNVTVSIPPFAVGTTSPVVVTATKINQALSSTVQLEVKDVAGNKTVCDPVFTLVVRDEGKPVTQTFTGLPQAESKVKIVNGDPGLAKLDITVNGKKFKAKDLADNVTQTIDVSSAMVPGNNNTITLEARGKPGGSAMIVISD